MPKARVYELAKDLGVDNKEIIAYLAGLGADVKNHMSVVDERFAELARRRFSPASPLSGSTVKAIAPRPVGLPPRVQRRQRGVGRPPMARPVQPVVTSTDAPAAPTVSESPSPALPEAAAAAPPPPPKEAKTAAPAVAMPALPEAAAPVPPAVAAPAAQPVAKEPAKPRPKQAPAPAPARPQVSEGAAPRPTAAPAAKSGAEGARRQRPQRSPRKPDETVTAKPASAPEERPAGRRPSAAPERRLVSGAPGRGQVARGRDVDGEGPESGTEGAAKTKRRGRARRQPLARPASQNGRSLAGAGGAVAARPGARPQARRRRAPAAAKAAPQAPEETGPKILTIPSTITVAELAEQLEVPATTVIKALMAEGVMAAINNVIDYEVAAMIAERLGAVVERTKAGKEKPVTAEVSKEDELVTRPPVVTILGHVDHGKTTLLDAIRETRVVETEAGGITQHIGAYQVRKNEQLITFLDTPGHEAFTQIRSRGAQITDIAILVVAADDGVMPQTIEALNHAKAAEVPIIVAINKIDRPGANPDRVKQQLSEHGLLAESWGGDTVMVEVSALKDVGIEDLLEMILLVAEMRELKANPQRPAAGTVIEAELDKTRGPVATILVQNGTLRPGDAVVAGSTAGRVRAMFDYRGKIIKEAGPSAPVSVLGLEGVPAAGDLVEAVEDERAARERAAQVADERKETQRAGRLRLSELFAKIQEGEVKDLNIVLKADVQGSVEALSASLEKLSDEQVRVNVIHAAAGGITETDVALAAASGAIIIGFNVRPEPAVRRAAEREEVDVRLYRIIYEAIDDIEAAIKGLLEPKYAEVVLGRAEVRAIFKVPGVGAVAGSYVIDGTIVRNALVRVLRDSVVIYEGKISSLKRFKDDVREVNEGYECGIGIERYNDIKEGDHLEAYQMQEVKQ